MRRTVRDLDAAGQGCRFAVLVAVFCLGVSGVVGAVRGARAPTSTEQGERPNIVFILTDDQRFDALGFMGHPFLDTPHLDALAAAGVVFDNAFVTTSLCSPSRASILTGQYAHRHLVLDNSTPLPPELTTFPRELQGAGYETAFVGKWHLGGGNDEPRAGFDRWVSFAGQGVYRNPTFNVDGERIPLEGYTTDLLTDYAVEFLEQQRDRPFLLYLSHKAVHAPFTPAERHRGSYQGERYPYPESMADTEENYAGKPEWVRAQRSSWHGVDGMYNRSVDFDRFALDYTETLRAVDDSVGRVMASLHDRGLVDDTLVVFTSDNGFQFGEHGLIDKRTMYEPSIRVPLIVYAPSRVSGGERRSEMILNIDFAPTFLEIAGVGVPNTMQGLSFLTLIGGGATEWRDAFLYEYFWERMFPQTPTVLGVRTDRYKLMKYHGVWDRYELYDLLEDPDERRNLIGNYVTRAGIGHVEYRVLGAPREDLVFLFGKGTDDPELRELFGSLHARLNELLEETGCAKEPNWVPRKR